MDKSLWERLRALEITPLAGALFSVVSIVALPFGDLAPGDDFADVLSELLLGAIVTGFFWLLVLPGLVGIAKIPPGSTRALLVLLVLVAGGVVRGLAVVLGADYFYFVSSAGAGQRVANSISTTVLWLGVFALFTHATRVFKARYEATLRRLTLARASRVSHSEVSKILSSLELGIKKVDPGTIDESLAREQMATIATSLERDIITEIKVHSRDLWSFSNAERPQLKMFPLLRLAMRRLDYSVWFVAGIFGVVGVLNLSSTVGVGEALWRVGLSLALIVAMDTVFRQWIHSSTRESVWPNILYLVAFGGLVQIPMGVAGYLLDNTPWAVVFIVLLIIPIAALPVMHSTLNLADSARDDLLRTVMGIDSRSDPSLNEPTHSSSELASYLHNSLQSEIQSVIVALKSAASDSTRVDVGKASLERLRIIANRSLDEEFAAFSRAPKDHLDQVIGGWKGILDIDLTWEVGALYSEDPRIATVVHIIEEVASNSAVHGGATTMTVSVSATGDRFSITIVNDAPMARMMSPGLGDSWLSQFAAEPSPRSQGSHTFSAVYAL